MAQAITRFHFTIIIEYEDNSEFSFEVILEGCTTKIMAELSMITRGTLMVTSAQKAIAYNDDGFDVISYIQ